MRGATSAKWVVGAVIVAMSATACGGGDTKADGESGGTFRFGITEPTAIDPVNAQESEGIVIARALFTGLYDTSNDGKLIPKLAESGTPSDDGKTWTFKIKAGTKFTNGEPVDAESFVRGWTRVSAKASASDVSYHMADIALLRGPPQRQERQVRRPDGRGRDHPQGGAVHPGLRVRQEDRALRLQPRAEGGSAGDNKAFNDQPIGNGAFKMTSPWQHNTSITLVRNDDYGLEKAHLAKVEAKILNPANGSTLEYQGFQSGQFDYARMPTPQLTSAKAKYDPQGEWISGDFSGINYLNIFNQNAPFNNPDARKAISYAIDREAIAKGVFQGLQKLPAFLPPSFADVYQAGVCSSCVKQDVAKAKEFAEKGGLKPGTVVNFGYNTGATTKSGSRPSRSSSRTSSVSTSSWTASRSRRRWPPSRTRRPPVCGVRRGPPTTRPRTTS